MSGGGQGGGGQGGGRQGSAGRTRRGLARLAGDVRANTLAMMAIALIPISALAGSAVDIARMYVVKARLQQACDAGVLAGRKFMTDSNSTTLDPTATKRAQEFFANNYTSGYMQTPVFTKTTTPYPFVPTKTSENRVAGSVTMNVPMTVMKMFAAPDVPLTVTCEAQFDVSDTDVIFVLDVTGSMACLPSDSDADCSAYVGTQVSNNKIIKYNRPSNSSKNVTASYAGSPGYAVPEKSGSRIAALRQAVLDFYDTMTLNIQPTTHVRYGFVTYTSTVNAGAAVQAMSPGYMLGGPGAGTAWNYQSRKVTADYNIGGPTGTTNNMNQTQCTASPTTTRDPAATQTQPYTYSPSSGTAMVTTRSWDAYARKCNLSVQGVGPQWTYAQYPQDVTGYVAGNVVTDPTAVDGSTTSWLGCLEERATTAGTTTFTTTGLPADLDPDLLPTSDDTRWKPMWPDVEYRTLAYQPSSGNTYIWPYANLTTNGDNYYAYGSYRVWGDNLNTSTNLVTGGPGNQLTGNISCGKPVYRLSTIDRPTMSAYVNAADFAPLGGTYHDTGMIWGVRMLSRTGIFASDNAAWAGRPNPKQVIVFLTDGDMAPGQILYGMYGMEYWDNRVMGGASTPDQKTFHNNRFLAECAKAQAMKIDVWTVSIAPSATAEMTQCASANTQALYSSSGTDLRDKFKAIAKQVARLRLSK